MKAGWESKGDGVYGKCTSNAFELSVPPVDGMARRITQDSTSKTLLEDLRLPRERVIAGASRGKCHDS